MISIANKNGGVKTKRIVVVDDHPVIREGLKKLLETESDLAVCGQAEDAFEALGVISELKPDLVIVDIALKKSSGLDLLKSIKAQSPKLPVLVMSMHHEKIYAERALRAGAKGYIMKDNAPAKIVDAIRQILNGRLYVSEDISDKLMQKLARGSEEIDRPAIDSLSDRELQVFQLMGEGYGTREIANKLYLSTKTVETYRSHIKEKLNLSNSSELLQSAIQWITSQTSA